MNIENLTKEQLEELHPEFINFLATQSIDKKEYTIQAESSEEAITLATEFFLAEDYELSNIEVDIESIDNQPELNQEESED